MTTSNRYTPVLWLAFTASVLVVLMLAWPSKEEFLYEGDLKPSEFRYKVFLTQSFNIMPGSGGPGVVRVYDAKGELIFVHSVKTTLSEISLNENGLFISGEGVWPLKTLRK